MAVTESALSTVMAHSLVGLLAEQVFKCSISRLGEKLVHPLLHAEANAYLAGKWVRTLYLRDGNRLLKVGGLTQMGADRLVAYEGYLSVTVRQHFYSRHRIRLLFPRLPCVVIYGPGGHNSYYPLELLTLVAPEKERCGGDCAAKPEGEEPPLPLAPAAFQTCFRMEGRRKRWVEPAPARL
jgi:hypothetical protein